MHPAERARHEKALHPERFCSTIGCLWKLADHEGKYLGPCMSTKHGHSLGQGTRDRDRLFFVTLARRDMQARYAVLTAKEADLTQTEAEAFEANCIEFALESTTHTTED
jgi:hypothetical protein